MADTVHEEARSRPLKDRPGGEVALLMALLTAGAQATDARAAGTRTIDIRPRQQVEPRPPQEVDDFYMRDRPANPTLPEDRPRGGGGPLFTHHKSWVGIGVVFAFFIDLIMGMALFA